MTKSEINSYYHNTFPTQLQQLLSKMPVGSMNLFIINFLFLDSKKHDLLSYIPSDELPLFLSALACNILFDQTIYTYFQSEYNNFRDKTNYPKLVFGLTLINANPWNLFDKRITLPRKLSTYKARQIFKLFVTYYLEDRKKYFKENFSNTNWSAIKNHLLNDTDVQWSNYGSIFIQCLIAT